MVGIKGTGTSALAEIFVAMGARVSGSDVPDVFYTDAILKRIGATVYTEFKADNLPADAKLVVYSAAYKLDQNPVLVEAQRRGLPCLVYPEALGLLSKKFFSAGISGVHGKTTTTAITGSVLKALNFPATVLAGSAVSNFGDKSTLRLGDEFFVAETCEYKKHFLNFFPRVIVLTSVESDHQDFYPTYADILNAFVEYGQRLPTGGTLIYCADDPGAVEAQEKIAALRPDLRLVPYGEKASGPFKIEYYRVEDEVARFKLAGFKEAFSLHIPGEHIALDATAAVALATELERAKAGAQVSANVALTDAKEAALRAGVAEFCGSKRRAEIVGEAGGVVFMDDYGHHPTAIRKTIQGIRAFYPKRRLVVDFMSHTYSRTEALLTEFSESFDLGDLVVMHKIYASARETASTTVSGKLLADLTKKRNPNVLFFEDFEAAFDPLLKELRPGDLFLTMGAGDNWKLGLRLLEALRARGNA
jgi:UDP-N-acetylmuramate--alanine ligase